MITGKRGTGEICMNGPAAIKISTGDKVIIIAYAGMTPVEAKIHKPKIVFPKSDNSI